MREACTHGMIPLSSSSEAFLGISFSCCPGLGRVGRETGEGSRRRADATGPAPKSPRVFQRASSVLVLCRVTPMSSGDWPSTPPNLSF